MKKCVMVLVLICALTAFASAAGAGRNLQKIHAVDSDVYQAIKYLYIDRGYSLPSTTGPWSSDELLKMLERIDPATLAAGALATYDFAVAALDEGKKPFKFGLEAAVEGYYHTNTAEFTRESDWIRGFSERKPALDLSLETWPSEHFYGFSAISVGNARYNGFGADGPTSTQFGSSAFTTNLPLVPPSVMSDLDFNIPYRAFGSFGGDGWNVEVGRDRMSWGPGESGNFVVGDNLLYQNVGRFTTYGKHFKYTFATSFFPHPANYYPLIDPSTGDAIHQGAQNSVDHGLSMFLSHRLEWRMFSDKVGLALTEAIMYQSLDNTIDLRVLSPTAIFHNYYFRANSNSILSLELDYSPIRAVNLYGQVVVDEFALPGEPVPGSNDNALPDGFGFMLGVKGSHSLGKGMLFGSAEWARTDPYLYLRDNGSYSQSQGQYGINWVVALREFSNAAGVTYTEDYLGYKYGGDAIVMNANAGYKQFGKWHVEGNFFYMLHGTHDKWTLWSMVGSAPGNAPNVQTPTTTHDTGNNADLTAQATRDAVSTTIVAGVNVGTTILPRLNIYGQADYIYIKNPGNISANAPRSDVQLTLGCSYSL